MTKATDLLKQGADASFLSKTIAGIKNLPSEVSRKTGVVKKILKETRQSMKDGKGTYASLKEGGGRLMKNHTKTKIGVGAGALGLGGAGAYYGLRDKPEK